MERQKVKQLIIHLPVDVHKSLKILCAERQETMSGTIAELIQTYVNSCKMEKFDEKDKL